MPKKSKSLMAHVKKPRKSVSKNGSSFPRNGAETEQVLVSRGRQRRAVPIPQGVTPAEKLAAFDRLATRDGIESIQDPANLTALFWPADESADEIVASVQELRRRGG